MHKNRRLTVLFSTLMLVSLGCNFVGQLFGSQGSGRREVSHEPPTLPAPPKPASAPQGTPDERAVYFADQLASGENRLAGWMGLYDALGVPVIDQDGTPLGSTGDDPIGPRYWQVWYASGLDLPGRGIPLSDAGRLIGAGLPQMDSATLGSVLLDDVRLAAQSEEPQVRLAGAFVRERVLRGPSHADVLDSAVTPETAVIDLPTVQLIGWMVMRRALFQSASEASVPSGPSLVDYRPGPPQRLLVQPNQATPCKETLGDKDVTYWMKWMIKKGFGSGVQLPGMEKPFAGVIERVLKALGTTKEAIGKVRNFISWANVFTSALTFAMQLTALDIDALQDPDPLVRTKGTSDGNEGETVWRLSYDLGKLPDGNKLGPCLLSYVAGFLGTTFSFPPGGRIAGAELKFVGGAGFPDLVLFGNYRQLRQDTNANGEATLSVIGRAQKRQLPDSATPIDKEFSIIVSAQPEAVTGNTLANIFFGGLFFGVAPSPARALTPLIDILKTFHYDLGEHVFRLTDWALPGYRAAGQDEVARFSGVVCSLEQPFTITKIWPGGLVTYQFTPSSPQAGTFSISGSFQEVIISGEGTYEVFGSEDYPGLLQQTHECYQVPGYPTYCKEKQFPIGLVPLDTAECGQP